MSYKIPEVIISKPMAQFHNEHALEGFIQAISEQRLLGVNCLKRPDESYVYIQLSDMHWTGSRSFSDMFNKIRRLVDQVELTWEATYEKGIYTSQDYQASKRG